MTARPLLLAPLLLLAALAGSSHAQAQDETRADIAMQNQILELRQQVDAMRDQVANAPAQPPRRTETPDNPGAPPSTDATTMLLDRVSGLEDQVRTLQGGQDEIRNTLQRQNADLAKQISDLAFRVQTLESGGAPASTPGPGAPDTAPPQTLSPPPHLLGTPVPPVLTPPPRATITPHATLAQGTAALARHDYPTAEAAARATLAIPHAPRAYDAQFLLAQSLAGQHNYQQAALAYDDTYTRQRKGPHAPDSLIGLASALTALGEKPAACATLDKLHGEFPATRPDIRASSAAIGRRASCH